MAEDPNYPIPDIIVDTVATLANSFEENKSIVVAVVDPNDSTNVEYFLGVMSYDESDDRPHFIPLARVFNYEGIREDVDESEYRAVIDKNTNKNYN